MAAVPPDLGAAEYFSYKVLQKDYTAAERAAAPAGTFGPGNTRKLAIESLQRGALMFHYFEVPRRNPAENNENYAHKVLDHLFGHFGVPTSWNAALNRWEFCFGSVVRNYHYYYPNPCAGFGVAGWGAGFNAAFICKTRRRSKWLYAKSGTHIPEDLAVHRRYPLIRSVPHPHIPLQRILQRNYDYLRVKFCNEIPAAGTCKDGNIYDLCATPRFQRDNEIDGVTSIAGADCLMDIELNLAGNHVFDTDKDMFRVIRSWRQQIQQNGNLPLDFTLWSMNLLCLESDKKGDTINVGFREFANSPFGHESPNRIPPRVLPAGTYGPFNGNYGVFDEEFAGPGVCVKRRFWLRTELVTDFFGTYIKPHLLFRPIGLVTTNSTYTLTGVDYEAQMPIQAQIAPGPDEPPFAPPMIAPAFGVVDQRPLLRYRLNHRIGQFLVDHCRLDNYDMAAGNNNGILFDRLHNVFYIDNDGLNQNVNVRYDANPESGFPLTPPLSVDPYYKIGYPINFYKDPFRINNRFGYENYKVLKELLTHKAWETYWMSELNVLDLDGEQTQVVCGPFFNPLTLPITAFDNLIPNYRRIITLLEGDRNIKSRTYEIFNNPDYVAYLNQLMASPIASTLIYNGIQYPYLLGIWFVDIHDVNAVARPRQAGGARTSNFESNFEDNFKKNFKKQYASTSKKTRKSKPSPSKTPSNGSETPSKGSETPSKESTSDREGHTSENITEITPDQIFILDYIQKHEILGKLWKLMFDDDSNTDDHEKNTQFTKTRSNKTSKKRLSRKSK